MDLKMMFIQELVKKKIVDVRKIGTLNNPADLLTKAVDQATLERLLWSTGVSRLHAPEIAEVTTSVKKSVVHVKRHLSAFMAASILAGAAGYDEDYEQEDKQHGWSVKTMILFVLFYGAYFGTIIGAWEDEVGCEEIVELEWACAEEAAREDDGCQHRAGSDGDTAGERSKGDYGGSYHDERPHLHDEVGR